jgi:hypothetical protein
MNKIQIRQLLESTEHPVEFIVGSIISSPEPGLTVSEKPIITFYNPRDLYSTNFVQEPEQGGLRVSSVHASTFMQTSVDNLLSTQYDDSEDMIAFVRQITKRGEITDTFKSESEYWYNAFVVKGIKFLILVSGSKYTIFCGLADFDYLPAIFPDFAFQRAHIRDTNYKPYEK